MIAPTYDSNRAAPMPATSPTLSPTLSAIVAGLRGSSSGMPLSTLPTRSAPTSAAFVKMPPPTLAKRAMDEAPNEKPKIGSIQRSIPITLSKTIERMQIPRSPSPTTVNPMTAPLLKATPSAFEMLDFAASVVRTALCVDTRMPTNPASALENAP